jgi:pimeloyl-ACP methyl ester carboxylesterase
MPEAGRNPSSGFNRRSQKKISFRGVKAMTNLHELSTSHGPIMVEEAGDGDLPVLLIHGNSLSREVFRKQLGGALSRKYRLVAFDLPGHGESSVIRTAVQGPS